jgi:uncharacterized protein YecA (UPF0149 family)
MAQTTMAPGGAFVTEIFTDQNRAGVLSKMDDRLKELQAEGHQLVRRTEIGRNTRCPCGSGLKFKKCCIDKAARSG